MKQVATDYIARTKKLSKEQKERVLSRMSGKLPKHLKNKKLTEEKAIAFQLELEDEQLQEWRDKMAKIRAKELKEKLKADAKLAKSKATTEKKASDSAAKKATAVAKKASPVKPSTKKPAIKKAEKLPTVTPPAKK